VSIGGVIGRYPWIGGGGVFLGACVADGHVPDPVGLSRGCDLGVFEMGFGKVAGRPARWGWMTWGSRTECVW
jgi:hypothetical protein